MGFSGRAMLTQQDFKTGFCLRAPEIKKHYETPRRVCVWGVDVYILCTRTRMRALESCHFFSKRGNEKPVRG